MGPRHQNMTGIARPPAASIVVHGLTDLGGRSAGHSDGCAGCCECAGVYASRPRLLPVTTATHPFKSIPISSLFILAEWFGTRATRYSGDCKAFFRCSDFEVLGTAVELVQIVAEYFFHSFADNCSLRTEGNSRAVGSSERLVPVRDAVANAEGVPCWPRSMARYSASQSSANGRSSLPATRQAGRRRPDPATINCSIARRRAPAPFVRLPAHCSFRR